MALSPDEELGPKLSAIAGYDPAAGLRCVGGQWPVLRRALRQFVEMYRDPAETLFGSGDGPQALDARASLAHSLRGVCSTIGAVALQDALRSHEAALRARAHALQDARPPADGRSATPQHLETPQAPQTVHTLEALDAEARGLRAQLQTLVAALRGALG